MYTPVHFEESRVDVMHDLMRVHPLATLVTLGANGLNANHIPMLLSEIPAPLGALHGHVARANSIWRDLTPGVESLAIFQGPQAYISPSWYATKQESGRVVPTWNYAVVHAYGTLRVIEDAAWLHSQLERLTVQSETGLPEPWHVADAPSEYTGKLMGAIVGIEFVISRLEGKWKVSQNQPPANQASAVAALQAQDTPAASRMASLISERAKGQR
jgi:transcriptional regulator